MSMKRNKIHTGNQYSLTKKRKDDSFRHITKKRNNSYFRDEFKHDMDVVDDFTFKFKAVIYILYRSENRKIWKTAGDYTGTCGYTAPSITILLLILDSMKIENMTELIKYFDNLSPKKITHFYNILNETIGNFLDLSQVCPETQVYNGIKGLITRFTQCPTLNQIKKLKVSGGYPNLVEGANLISFVGRGDSRYTTFHHAVIYIANNNAYVIDSWADGGPNTPRVFTCRHPTYRQIDKRELFDSLNALISTNDLAVTHAIMLNIFMAHQSILNTRYNIDIYVTENSYIMEIYNRISNANPPDSSFNTAFGGRMYYSNRTPKKRRRKTIRK